MSDDGRCGMCKVLIYGYDVVQPQILWDAVQQSIPTLLNQIEVILHDLEKPIGEKRRRE